MLDHRYHRDTASIIESIDATWLYSPATHPLADVIVAAYQEELI